MAAQREETLQAAARGDGQAWHDLVHAYTGRVYALLYRQCGSPELAEEITQATFVKIVTELPNYHELGRFEAWLFRIAVNRLRDEQRRQKRQARPMDFTTLPPQAVNQGEGAVLPLETMQQQERHDQLNEAVQRLPQADQELLNLRYTAELSFAQIAETLGEPLGTVLARGHRALKKLRRILEPNEVEYAKPMQRKADPTT
ncbi:MAG: sigma-70 family RNA polymerase sigma factor [Phycisphaeraceae bacterium]